MESSDKETLLIISGIPVKPELRLYAPYKPYTGSIKMTCECGIECWIGPKQQELLKKGCRMLCMPCTLQFAKEAKEINEKVEVAVTNLGNNEVGKGARKMQTEVN